MQTRKLHRESFFVSGPNRLRCHFLYRRSIGSIIPTLLTFTVSCSLAFLSPTTASAQTRGLPSNTYLRQQVDKLLKYETPVNYEHTPGFIIGIYDNGFYTTLSYGSKLPGSQDTLTRSDIFEIGSVSKVFTAMVLTEMERRDLIDFENSIINILPGYNLSNDLSNTTVNELLTHRSGLPKVPDGIGLTQSDPQNPYKNYSIDQFDAYLKIARTDKSDLPVYSNTGYALLELIIENVSESSFSEALDSYCTSMIGLQCTSTFTDRNKLTPGFNLAGEIAQPWNFPTFSASEGIKTCMSDCLLLVDYLLNNATTALWEIAPVSFNKNLATAPGWFVIRDKKTPDVFAHAGRTSGYNAYLAVVPQTRTAVVILANSAAGTDDLGLNILRIMNRNWNRK